MQHLVTCPCGQQSMIAEEHMGQTIRCPTCLATFETPVIATLVAPAQRRVMAEIVSPSQQPLLSPPKSPKPPPAKEREPFQQTAPSVDDPAIERRIRQLELDTGSSAANPGRLRLNWLLYVLCFPTWPLTWGLPIAAAIALAVLVHPAFVLLGLPFVGCLYLLCRRENARFVGGCLNPGQIVSLDPPLVAVLTGLGNGMGPAVPVIKILWQPLGRMTPTAELAVGQRVAAVALYTPDFRSNAPHWTDFEPVVINTGVSSVADIERTERAISASDWQELAQGLSQLPTPTTPGLYCVVSSAPSDPEKIKPWLVNFVLRTNLNHDADNRRYLADAGLPPETLTALAEMSGGQFNPQDAFAVLQGFDRRCGIVLTPTHVKVVSRGGYFEFPWQWLAGVLGHTDGIEFVFRNGQRVQVEDHTVWRHNIWPLEQACQGVLALTRESAGEDVGDEA